MKRFTLSLLCALFCLAAEKKEKKERGPCGDPWQLECPMDYTLEEVNKSAAEHIPYDMAADQAQAESECREKVDVLESGGWCLGTQRKKEMISLPNNHSYWLSQSHGRADAGILSYLISLVDEDPGVTINDFGAGVGQYGHELLAERPNAHYRGWDAAGDIEDYTNHFLHWFDLTKPVHLPKADYVMSLEVGEHIPHKHEKMVIRNLHAHNTKGVILSWAKLGQMGHHHVNCHSANYIVKIFEGLGYYHDWDVSKRVRRQAKYRWFRSTFHVFRRLSPLQDHPLEGHTLFQKHLGIRSNRSRLSEGQSGVVDRF
mmetsp:Transcript_33362/g.52155  ORF Transcript_33362/g.52155 Transcript_33362/m.52155 type:complete len:314 (-) Transcript_33362:236-1177(-)|eukprot:CAMPEP_0201508224 /NCGR_PEP_ID=MMETSP0161_2-20130828/1649_1 /ASSEMBLY_ACC=CAM_ASM_000251 /TAXON_ID=180227 /ORGANISM="Neoparamoeba aestuarina, Strain SoJaBio B1-5/56/2" /LENGTH=313 /DNA_ID=CAMNT_0047902809 /DNA_START=181 /DNA_END=1122 /DNA_ORIENTATION=-